MRWKRVCSLYGETIESHIAGAKDMTKLGPDQRIGYKNIGVIEGYAQWASSYDQDPNPLIAVEEKVTLECIGNAWGKQVLDLGCGTGRYCVLLAEQGARVVGIDPCVKMLQLARQKVTPASRFELHCGTIEDMKFPTEHFDLIVTALTLGHLPDLEPTFREAVRVLKNNGHMVISDVHPFWPLSGHDYTEFFSQTGQEYRIPVYPHSLEEYWHLCKKYCLQVEDLREPKIDENLIESFPSLKDYKGIPLAIVIKLRKSSLN